MRANGNHNIIKKDRIVTNCRQENGEDGNDPSADVDACMRGGGSQLGTMEVTLQWLQK